jgi:hypothetical protein
MNVLQHYPVVETIVLSGVALVLASLLLLIPRTTRRWGRLGCYLTPIIVAFALWADFMRVASDRYYWSVALQMTLYALAAGFILALLAWPLHWCARRWPSLSFLTSFAFWVSVVAFVVVSWFLVLVVRDLWFACFAGDTSALFFMLVIFIWPVSWVYVAIAWFRRTLAKRRSLSRVL